MYLQKSHGQEKIIEVGVLWVIQDKPYYIAMLRYSVVFFFWFHSWQLTVVQRQASQITVPWPAPRPQMDWASQNSPLTEHSQNGFLLDGNWGEKKTEMIS